MLSILHPETMPHLRALPVGLLPFRSTQSGKLLLAVKAPKEMILAARINRGFKIYVVPLASTIGLVPALVTAFFDDADEPLIVMTPLFDDDVSHDIRELLAYEELKVYFLDEHNREWMSYRARVQDGGSCFVDGTDLTFVSYSHNAMTLIYKGLEHWFGRRTTEDDARAITVSFVESIGPDDLFIHDRTEVANNYLGSTGFSNSTLARENPGSFQERDLVAAFRRVFPGDRIAINPKRKDTGRELADIVVLASSHILLVQAKDSPNTEESLGRSLDRKRRVARHQLDKGMRQAKGAVAYAQGHDPLDLFVGERDLPVTIGSRILLSIVVIKEIFADEGDLYVSCSRTMAAGGVRGIVLDYPSLDLFAHRLSDESEFLVALEEYRALLVGEGCFVNPQSFVLDWLAGSRI